MNLRNQILEYVKTHQGWTARDIADDLEINKLDVLTALRKLKAQNQIHQDASYRWWSGEGNELETHLPTSLKISENILGHLARYYLDCIDYDDQNSISTYADSKYSAKYAELLTVPRTRKEWERVRNDNELRGLLAQGIRSREKLHPILGYPIFLKYVKNKRGNWEGFIVEPILYYRLDGDSNNGDESELEVTPMLNSQAIRDLSGLKQSEVLEEAIYLSEELGLYADDYYGELDEILDKLRSIQPDWPWMENIDPYELNNEPPLKLLKKGGIYNRCIVMMVKDSNITRGLKSELSSLMQKKPKDLKNTALGDWLGGTVAGTPGIDEPLLEIIPLNVEQRAAVQNGLRSKLTVVTGPPGTGKSQVVMSLVLNAAWRGMTTLFASKNNKAVDVVERRINSLGSRPALLRLGRGDVQIALSEYLTALLSATVAEEDRTAFESAKQRYEEIRSEYEHTNNRVETAIEFRNTVDSLEKAVRDIEAHLGVEWINQFRELDIEAISEKADHLGSALRAAERKAQAIGIRILWPIVRRDRFSAALKQANNLRDFAEILGVPIPRIKLNDESLVEWEAWFKAFYERLEQAEQVRAYYKALEHLRTNGDIAKLHQQLLALTAHLADESLELWRLWLRIQPDKLDQQERSVLYEYSTIVRFRVEAESKNKQINRSYYRRFKELFPKVMQILPCWAITSLSARGRLPLEPGMFDLLIIDEASQCDIASALPLLYRAKRAVIIGDPMQLRHITNLPSRKDQQLLARHGLVTSHLNWSYSVNSLFDVASSLCPKESMVDLRDHYRSHADIISFANGEFYEGRLRVATKYEKLQLPSQNEPAVRWIDVKGKVERPSGRGTIKNRMEAERVIEELKVLVQKRGYVGSVGVVSPFRAQANLIHDLIDRDTNLSHLLQERDFEANTVHAFQGDERDVIIFSPVISDNAPNTAKEFLKRNANLFNVAITRARSALIVVGDRECALESDIKYLNRFARYVEKLGSKEGEKQAPGADLGRESAIYEANTWSSEWEDRLRAALEGKGLHVESQVHIDKYVLDLVLVIDDRRLDIEVDGETYHRRWNGELVRRDQLRNMRLFELGWDVIRFWVYQVRDDLPWCVNRVLQWALDVQKRAASSQVVY